MKKTSKQNVIPYRYKSNINGSAPRLFEYLLNGGNDINVIKESAQCVIDYIDNKCDCSDFRACILVRILYTYKDVIGVDVYNKITTSLINLPYDDTSGNSMCTWTENHQVLFNSTQYLMGLLCPTSIFSNGKTGYENAETGRQKLYEWISYIELFGLSEWCSCNYYPETLAGLGNLVQFGKDGELVERCKNLLDYMCEDIVSGTYFSGRYVYNKATARAYVDNKTNYLNYLVTYTKAMLGESHYNNNEVAGCFTELLKATDGNGNNIYKVPDNLKDIINTYPRVVTERNGVDVDKAVKIGLTRYSEANTRYLLSSGALVNYQTISNAVRYFDEHDMWQNSMINQLSSYAKPILYRTPLLKLIKRCIHVPQDGMATGEGNVYTYVDKDFSLSTAVKYHVGANSFQQNIFAISMEQNIGIFGNCPSKTPDLTAAPDYWLGSKVNPHAEQYNNNVFAIYKLNKKCRHTHLFFPTALFDKIDTTELDQGYLFAQKGSLSIAVVTNIGAYFVSKEQSANDKSLVQDGKVDSTKFDEYDLTNKAQGNHFYYVTVQRTDMDNLKKQLLNNVHFNGKDLIVQSDKSYKLSYNKYLTVDGVKQPQRYGNRTITKINN